MISGASLSACAPRKIRRQISVAHIHSARWPAQDVRGMLAFTQKPERVRHARHSDPFIEGRQSRAWRSKLT